MSKRAARRNSQETTSMRTPQKSLPQDTTKPSSDLDPTYLREILVVERPDLPIGLAYAVQLTRVGSKYELRGVKFVGLADRSETT